MEILFICGCLEPGFDGVGDYARRLGGELVRQGHDVSLLALYDRHVKDEVEELQKIEGAGVTVLRIPGNTSNERRYSLSKKFIQLKNPEWLSLQYVPYAFHKKGLPYKLAANLAALGIGRKWHVMFHELWVGDENLKNSIVALLQKALIKRLLYCFKPAVVHTHLPDYLSQLQSIGQIAKELPLFSNIPVVNRVIEKNDRQFTIGFFSQAEISTELLYFFVNVQKQLVEVGKEIQILFIGGSPARMKVVGDFIEKEPQFRNKINYTGYLSPSEISVWIQSCNLGITPLPLFTLGKSGSVAAFLAHQIPVAVPVSGTASFEVEKPFFNSEMNKALLLGSDMSKLGDVTNAAILAKEYCDLSKIATKFLSDLN